MTILHIQFVGESWKPSETSSGHSFRSAGSAPHFIRLAAGSFAAHDDEAPVVADALDDLIADAERSNAVGMAEARKWVGQAFYADTDSLSALRLRLGLSQQQLAERCGMRQSNISRYEAGGARPTDRCARILQEALQVATLEDVYRAYDKTCADRDEGGE